MDCLFTFFNGFFASKEQKNTFKEDERMIELLEGKPLNEDRDENSRQSRKSRLGKRAPDF